MWINTHIKIKARILKTIQMTIDENLLQRVDETAQAIQTNRSAFIRKALEMALQHYHLRQLEQQDAEGYARIPAQLEEIEVWLPEQAWGDEWNEGK
jgi:metal-responsive CopG/Arc/MetJ family transcriptional regulator